MDQIELFTPVNSAILKRVTNNLLVTLARAVELKHSSSLIAALANETSQLYKRADDALASLDAKIVTKWRKYFQLKSDFYLAYAYSYHGETLLTQDKCGEAIRGLQEAIKCKRPQQAVCIISQNSCNH